MFNSRRLVFVTAALASLGTALRARADFLDVRMFNTANYTQNASGTVFQNYTFEMDAITQSAAGFNSAQVTYPGAGSPVALTQSPTDSTFFNKYFGPYASLAALQTALPFGDYTTSFTNGTITDSATIDYSAEHFQSSVPELSPVSLTELEDLNPSQSVTLDFNAFTPDSATNSTVGTYVIISGPNSTPFSTFVAPGVTSVTVPAGTLLGNTSYSLAIDQGGRIATAPNAEGVNTEFGFAVDDNINFTTAPEPGALGLSLAGVLVGLFAYRSRVTRKGAREMGAPNRMPIP